MSSLARGFVFVRCCAGGLGAVCALAHAARTRLRGDDSQRLRKQVRLFFGQRRSICAPAWSS